MSWGPNNKFKFPLLGTGMLYERIAESLPKPVELRQEASSTSTSTARSSRSPTATSTTYDKLVTTMPLTELLPLIAAVPGRRARARLATCTTPRACSSASVSPNRARAPSAGCTSPSSDSPFYRVTYLSNYSPQMTPGPGSLLAARRGVCRRRTSPRTPTTSSSAPSRAWSPAELLTPRAGRHEDRQPPAACGCPTRTRFRRSAATPRWP